MIGAEFQQYFGHINPEEVQEVTDRWFATPSYVDLPEAELAKVRALTELKGDIKTFTDHTTHTTADLVKAEKHFEALDFMNQRLAEAEATLTGDDLLTARRYSFYRRGYVQEHLATYGAYSKLELGHPVRTVAFLSAARDYMLSDLELGAVTDYGLRAAECFGGARLGGLQMSALGKLFSGTRGIALVGRNTPDMIIVKDLMRRATETIELGPVPNGKNVVVIKGEYPEPRLN